MEDKKSLWVGMVILGAMARLLPHPWNFTPLMAIALFAGSKAQSTRMGAIATLTALAVSDAVLGFYHGFWWMYAAALIPVLLGRLIRNRQTVGTIAGTAAVSSVMFFLTTNFVVWTSSRMYPHSLAGLGACYVAGLPFFQNQVMGDAVYTVGIFGGYALLKRWAQPQMQTA